MERGRAIENWRGRPWRTTLVAGATLIGVVIAAVALYWAGAEFISGRTDRQEATVATPADGSASSDEFAFSFFDPPRPVPNLEFVDGDDHPLTLEDFRGRPILLNIWATWCVPCRKEMPALDRLQAAFDPKELLVLPLSIDRKGAEVVKPFYQELGLRALGIFVDRSGKASNELKTVGVPTTLLIDREGREVGRKIGAAEWDGAEIVALLRKHLGLPSNDEKKAAR